MQKHVGLKRLEDQKDFFEISESSLDTITNKHKEKDNIKVINLIKSMGIIGSNFSIADKKFPIVDTADIAAVAIDELLTLKLTGSSVEYIASDEVSKVGHTTGVAPFIVVPGKDFDHVASAYHR